jgi:hypothetical protein
MCEAALWVSEKKEAENKILSIENKSKIPI